MGLAVLLVGVGTASAAVPLYDWGNRCPLGGAYGTMYVGDKGGEMLTDIASMRFTAGTSATVEYARWTHADHKFNGTPDCTLSLTTSDPNGLPDMSNVLTSKNFFVSKYDTSPTTQFDSPAGLTAGTVYHLVWQLDPNTVMLGDPNNMFSQDGDVFRMSTQDNDYAPVGGTVRPESGCTTGATIHSLPCCSTRLRTKAA